MAENQAPATPTVTPAPPISPTPSGSKLRIVAIVEAVLIVVLIITAIGETLYYGTRPASPAPAEKTPTTNPPAPTSESYQNPFDQAVIPTDQPAPASGGTTDTSYQNPFTQTSP